jgi:hypothetical protein
MKRVLILIVTFVLTAGIGVYAQTSTPKASDQGVNADGKGGTYVAPSTYQIVTGVKAVEQPATGTGSVNPNPVANKSAIPDDFPKFVNTGNALYDQEVYDKAKSEWIRNNPERYKAMLESNNPQK